MRGSICTPTSFVVLLLILVLAPLPSGGFAAGAKRSGGKRGATTKKAAAGGGGGFGASSAKQPKLDPKAKRILKEMGGNVDAAQEAHFQNAMRALRKDDPSVYEELMSARDGLPTGDAHAKLVELFWDAVAVYLPARERGTDGASMGAKMKSKVEAIAYCSTEARGAVGAAAAVLDVGCGDGAMVPHLQSAGADIGGYLGLDLSERMVDAAAAAHPKAAFRQADMLSLDPRPDFDTVLLNGASQFFADQTALVRSATEWLRPDGRVVIAHAQGAAFVREEHRGNPAVARSCLPDPAQLRSIADELQLEVLPAEACVPAASALGSSHTLEGEDFYLVALQKKAES